MNCVCFVSGRVVDVVDQFFFSSRRRHTSCSRDWSSDVCSSDRGHARRRRGRGRLRPPRRLAPANPRGVRLHAVRSEEHTSELQSRLHLVCRLLLEKKKTTTSSTWFDQTNKTHIQLI